MVFIVVVVVLARKVNTAMDLMYLIAKALK